MPCSFWLVIVPGDWSMPRRFPPAGGGAVVAGRLILCGVVIVLLCGVATLSALLTLNPY